MSRRTPRRAAVVDEPGPYEWLRSRCERGGWWPTPAMRDAVAKGKPVLVEGFHLPARFDPPALVVWVHPGGRITPATPHDERQALGASCPPGCPERGCVPSAVTAYLYLDENGMPGPNPAIPIEDLQWGSAGPRMPPPLR
jgi:hypothetical protein